MDITMFYVIYEKIKLNIGCMKKFLKVSLNNINL